MTRFPTMLSLFGRLSAAFLVPARTSSAAARSRRQGRPPGRRAPRLALDGDEPGGTLTTIRTMPETSRGARASVSLLLAIVLSGAAAANASAEPPRTDATDAAVAEAALRFSLPPGWILAVIEAESGGRSTAISSAGAMGLMQLMPGTWRDIRAELGLGDDPFDPRDNVLAGAFYLRRLLDRFGPRGFLAAYHAGPGRYEQRLVEGRPLPVATRLYVARFGAVLGFDPPLPGAPPPVVLTRDWRSAGLFVTSGPRDPQSPAGPLFISLGGQAER